MRVLRCGYGGVSPLAGEIERGIEIVVFCIISSKVYSVCVDRPATNNYRQKALRQVLRNRCTPAEWRLWWHLRRRQFLGLRWRRQVSIGKYIVDFYCFENRIAIEIDGDSHFDERAQADDRQRSKILEDQGVSIIRFTNPEIMHHTDQCLNELREFCEKGASAK